MRKIAPNAWFGVIGTAFGVLGLTVVGLFGSTTVPHSKVQNLFGWAIAVLIMSILVLILGIAILGEWIDRSKWRREDRAQRIESLTTSLKDALSLIDTIREEIEEGEEALRKIQTRAAYAKEIAKLTEEEAAAVRSVLRDEFRIQGRSSLNRNIVLSGLFFCLGVVVTVVVR